MRLPLVRITVTWHEIPVMHWPPPRLTLQRMMIGVVIAGLFFAWVYQWEMHRVAQTENELAMFAKHHPLIHNDPDFTDAWSLARPWAKGWFNTLGSSFISFCIVGFTLWLAYRTIRFALSLYLRWTAPAELR